MRDLSTIVDEGLASLERLLNDAFEAGRAIGRQEAATEFRARLMGLTDDLVSANVVPAADANAVAAISEAALDREAAPSVTGRAAPGSVKPVVTGLVRDEPGITTEQIVTRTGLKRNSVRGTLWTLSATDKVIERRGHGWFPAAQKDEPSDELSGGEASEGSVDQPQAQGREAVPGGGG